MQVDIQAIIDRVTVERAGQRAGRAAQAGRPQARVYDDEPILKTGRQVLVERERRLPPAYLPARRLEHEGAAKGWPNGRIFAEEGRLLSGVTDEAPYTGPFERYYPTYSMMDDWQLRGYVTWRGQVRAGEAAPAPASFAFVYVYELLNGIGWDSPAQGFAELGRFWRAQRQLMPELNRYVRGWLADFAAYYGVERALVEADPAFSDEVARARAVWALEHPEGLGEDELFGVLVALSGYRVEGSRFYRDYPEDMRHVAVSAAGALDAYCRKNRRHGLYESLFGWPVEQPREMFASSVFNGRRIHEDCEYSVGPFTRYRCRAGRWTLESLQGGKGGGTRLGAVMKLVDARMRERYGYQHPLKDPGGAKYLVAIVDREVDAWLEERRAREAARVTIDLSKLGAIRASAAATCDALLVDEERGEEEPRSEGWGERATGVGLRAQPSAMAGAAAPQPVGPAQAAAGAAAPADARLDQADQPQAPGMAAQSPAPAASFPARPAPAAAPDLSAVPASPALSGPGASGRDASAPFGLTPAELELLQRLLAGELCRDAPEGAGMSLDMLVDSVNEKLYELIGDTAVEFGPEGPQLVEDYREDVEGVVHP